MGKLSKSIVVLFVLLLSLSAQSQGSSTTKAINEPKKTALSFEDELVEGATAKPDISYIFQKKNFNYKRLIKLRENFIPEMRRTAEDMQRYRR
jgi:hypothetical protein